MKIYTQTGDDGTTGLIGGERVSKADVRLQAYGTIDELNALLGVARASDLSAEVDPIVEQLQHQMFILGAELATPKLSTPGAMLLGENVLDQVESWIDQLEAKLPPLKNFILPGGVASAAALHHARCVCRRAERCVIALSGASEVRPLVIKYVNRVGDLLFVLARTANLEAGRDDVPWKKPADS